MRKHLAIMDKVTIEDILNGKKTIETRFSKKKIIPFGEVEVGDIIYMKPPGGEVLGEFKVKKVISYQGLDPEDFEKIFNEYGEQVKSNGYGMLIFIGQSERFITSPIKINKKDKRNWVIL